MSSSNYRIGVIGSGVIGLTAALHLAIQHRNLDITIISDKDLTQTTSYGPGGLFRPSVSDATTKQWARDSYDYFVDLGKSADGPLAGVQLVSGYCLGDSLPWLKEQERSYSDIVTDFRWLQQSDMEIFSVPFKYGIFYTATTAQTHFYLPWLAQKARLAGVRMEKRNLADRFDLIINCSGLGARTLVPDESVVPVRGITVNVSAPWIKHFLLCDDSMTFAIPGIDSVFLGTLREKNNWKTEIDPSEPKAVLRRCCEVLPSLKRAPVRDTWVGLRPFRPVPRLEIEVLKTNIGSIPVIHNYGHGGNGVTFSWGSATHVNRLLNEELRTSRKSISKL